MGLRLKTLFKDPEQVTPFLTYLEKRIIHEGEILFRQGDPANAIYFVELGQLSTVIELIGGRTKPVQVFGSGKLIGEVDFYTQAVHQTTAIADSDSCVYQLTHTALHQMQQERPQTAVVFSEMLLSLRS
ncbi:MAG: cyclic nucleotide-binding domain-containing protein [Leptolyngbyaceae cyanobacterium RU_5_1]|nr:cyclic nucleotide-binding domain-containing protein [Leptolyngbyaceae cyanobacterium RU_5_1]